MVLKQLKESIDKLSILQMSRIKTPPAILIICLLSQSLWSQNKQDREYILNHTNVDALTRFAEEKENLYKSFLLKKGENVKEIIVNSKGRKGYLSGFTPEGKPEYDFDDNIEAAATIRTRELWQGGSTGYNLDGTGVVIGHWEAGGVPMNTHQELVGRIYIRESGGSSSHATHTACTMIGTGVDYFASGMAPGATIEARRSDNDEAELAAFAADGGILSNHSYHSNDPEGDIPLYGSYNDNSKEWDEITYNAPYLLICKSAGNTRNEGVNTGDHGYDILFPLAVAKNILVVGAVDDILKYLSPSDVIQSAFTSWGPTDDWRIKPDVTANGVGLYSADNFSNTSYDSKSGTSMSVASVTGTVALLQQLYHDLNDVYMRSATVKALLICTTEEAGEYDGPDFQSGWGLVNAEKAANLIANNGHHSYIGEHILGNGETFSTDIQADGVTPLSVVIAWTDPAGTPIGGNDNQTPMLVNDLDLRITGNGNTYFPWMMEPNATSGNFTDAALKGDNYRDNVERIDAGIVPAGTYTVTVSHKGTITNDYQPFSLVMQGLATGLSVEWNSSFNERLVKVWPQPSRGGYLHVEITEPSALGPVSTEILDLTGKVIQKTIHYGPQFTLDISAIERGIYLLKTETAVLKRTRLIIIE